MKKKEREKSGRDECKRKKLEFDDKRNGPSFEKIIVMIKATDLI